MKTAYLVQETGSATACYRAAQYIPYLAERGIEAALIRIPARHYDRLHLFRTLNQYDLVILVGRLMNLAHFRILRHFSRRLVFDLDDALFLRDSKAPTPFSLTRRIRFRRTVRLSDFILCGNAWLLERVKRTNPRAELVPTVIDLTRYVKLREHKQRPCFRAVWIGSSSTLFYLERILPFIEQLSGSIDRFSLRVIADRFPRSEAVAIEKIPWSSDNEAALLGECDAGLMPLLDDNWSKGKCGLKLLQYGAAGLPSVCSPTTANEAIVKNGISGFHASSPEQWRESLIKLARDAGMRSAMGEAARETVSKRYSIQENLDRYIGLLCKASRN